MLQCLLIEDDPVCRMLLKAALEKCGCLVEAPDSADDLSRIFARGQQFDVIVFDGCLWGNLSWFKIASDMRRALVEDGRLICISADGPTAAVASRFFGKPVDWSGKDPGALEDLILQPELVGK